jgi:hypothetical protein
MPPAIGRLQLRVPFLFNGDCDSIGATGSQCRWLGWEKRGAPLFGARAGRGFARSARRSRACGLSVLIRSSPRNFRPAEQLEFATSGDGLGPRRPSSLLRKGSRPAMTPCQVTSWSLTPIQL